jgi:hypothetical protein
MNNNRNIKPKFDKKLIYTGIDVVVESKLPWLSLTFPFDIPYTDMFQEAKALRKAFIPHRTLTSRGWMSLCIHGISSVHTEFHDQYKLFIERPPYTWTDISKFCPVTTEFFKNVFDYTEYDRIRFMLLEPGGYILPHIDNDLNKLTALNISLNNPENCEFVMANYGIVSFKDGTVNMLAINNEHAVWNNSNQDRFHIIVHGSRNMNGHWNRTILNSYEKFFNE